MRLLIRYDVPTWALYRRAWNFEKHAPKGWEVVSCSDAASRTFPERYWDAVLLLDPTQGMPPYAGDRPRIVRLIASHAWLYEREDLNDLRTRGVNNTRNWTNSQGIVASSDIIATCNQEQAKQFRLIHPDVRVLNYSIDTGIWYREDFPSGNKLRVGWCYQISGGRRSFKGFSEILLPLIAKVGEMVEWRVEHPEANTAMGAEELRKWYSQCDIFLCTSSAEGGPQPPFEAAGCGCIPLVTDVGELSDWKDLRDAGLVVPTYRTTEEAGRTIQLMADKIRWMASNHSEVRRLRQFIEGSVVKNYDARMVVPRQLDMLLRK